MIVPLIFVVSLSSIMTPSVSPQYGLSATYKDIPTTVTDRIAIDWMNRHMTGDVLCDTNCHGYWIFARYNSGVLSPAGIANCGDCTMRLPDRYNALFVRWSDTIVGRNNNESCQGLASSLASRLIVNIVYDNSCGTLGAVPNWK